MPHVIVKRAAGRTEAQKTRLAEGIVTAVVAGARMTGDAARSVA